MFRKTKLRGPIGRIYPIFIISAHVLAIVEFIIRREMIEGGMDIFEGPVLATAVASLFFVFMGVYQYYRYHLWVYLVLGLLAGASTFQSTCQYTDFFTLQSYIINIMLVVIFVILAWPVLAAQERFEAKARRLFKLAADTIEETDAGFTARPFSIGNAKYDQEEIIGFARYLKSKHIASPFYSKEGIYLCLSMGKSLLKDPQPSEISYVLFSNKGEVSVHIAAFDYKQYTKRFSFDRLCSSLGNTMQRFFEYYKDGHEERILDELKSV